MFQINSNEPIEADKNRIEPGIEESILRSIVSQKTAVKRSVVVS